MEPNLSQFEDYYLEPAEQEPTQEICPSPDCLGLLTKEAVSNGGDDFSWTWTCTECGDTWSN